MQNLSKLKVSGIQLTEAEPGPQKKLAKVARRAGAEGIVMLKNENNCLPFRQGEVISVFGRIQKHYFKSGTGSGGCVNVDYVVDIPTGLRRSGVVRVNEKLAAIYDKWIEKHPYDNGIGWNSVPWAQVEMPLTDKIVSEAAAESDAALVILGRTAGESRDNHSGEGSWELTRLEAAMIRRVKEKFGRVCVALNVGNIIDMKWVEKYGIDAVVYVWQGGQEGGNSVADVLCGKVSPSGKLTDTIARNLTDYISGKNFGGKSRNIYAEDIYVGYRYFETLAPQKVLYPFGFGLSYTTFDRRVVSVSSTKKYITMQVEVTNSGAASGKEVVEIYVGAPQGCLGKPARVLVDFKKTKTLAPGESQILKFKFSVYTFASYDDGGYTGNKSCYVLEHGDYVVYLGGDVRSAIPVYTYPVSRLRVISRCTEACAPVTEFDRLTVRRRRGGGYTGKYLPAPQRTIPVADKVKAEAATLPEIPYTGDRGIKLVDVAMGKATLDDFMGQLDVHMMRALVKGEGMCSPKVTPGTGGAIGGLSDALTDLGIPPVCVSDGPSGIRMDGGGRATSLPNGTLLACSFNEDLVEELFACESIELYANSIDCLLGPGMNIHRHPLNGRNFEYFSEDPLVSGKIAAANCRGVAKGGATCTIKHYLCNNQEDQRTENDSVVSERAIREIYAKGFEIAIREGNAMALMTSYNMVNGIHAASNYDSTTIMLRQEFGYRGLVMTDWWAKMNLDGEGERTIDKTAEMVRAQNDIYMVCQDSWNTKDNIDEALASGILTRAQLQRCAKHVLEFILESTSFAKYVAGGCKLGESIPKDAEKIEPCLVLTDVAPNKKYDVPVGEDGKRSGKYVITVEVSSDAAYTEQIPFTVVTSSWSGGTAAAMSFRGTEGKTASDSRAMKIVSEAHQLRFDYDEKLLHVKKVTLRRYGNLFD